MRITPLSIAKLGATMGAERGQSWAQCWGGLVLWARESSGYCEAAGQRWTQMSLWGAGLRSGRWEAGGKAGQKTGDKAGCKNGGNGNLGFGGANELAWISIHMCGCPFMPLGVTWIAIDTNDIPATTVLVQLMVSLMSFRTHRYQFGLTLRRLRVTLIFAATSPSHRSGIYLGSMLYLLGFVSLKP